MTPPIPNPAQVKQVIDIVGYTITGLAGVWTAYLKLKAALPKKEAEVLVRMKELETQLANKLSSIELDIRELRQKNSTLQERLEHQLGESMDNQMKIMALLADSGHHHEPSSRSPESSNRE